MNFAPSVDTTLLSITLSEPFWLLAFLLHLWNLCGCLPILTMIDFLPFVDGQSTQTFRMWRLWNGPMALRICGWRNRYLSAILYALLLFQIYLLTTTLTWRPLWGQGDLWVVDISTSHSFCRSLLPLLFRKWPEENVCWPVAKGCNQPLRNWWQLSMSLQALLHRAIRNAFHMLGQLGCSFVPCPWRYWFHCCRCLLLLLQTLWFWSVSHP